MKYISTLATPGPLLLAAFLIWACGDNEAPPPAVNGDACMVDSDCESGVCLTEWADGEVLFEGLCTDVCEFTDEIQGTCEDEAEMCLRYNPTEEHHCYQTCGTDDDCRDGWSCLCIGFFCTDQACLPF